MKIDPYRAGSDSGGGGPLVPSGGYWDAETGAMTGWTTTLGNPQVRTDVNRHAPQGNSIYDGGNSPESRCYQRIDLSTVPTLNLSLVDAGSVDVRVDWWGGTFEQGTNDQPEISLIFRNAALGTISTYASGLKTPLPIVELMRWDSYIELTDVPTLTRYIDVEMHFHRNTGSNNDGAIDDVRVRFIQ